MKRTQVVLLSLMEVRGDLISGRFVGERGGGDHNQIRVINYAAYKYIVNTCVCDMEVRGKMELIMC